LESSSKEIFQTTSCNNRVIKHYSCGDKSDKGPHPGIVFSHYLSERADNTQSCLSAHRNFDNKERDGPEKEEKKPGNNKGTSAILGDNPGETPDIACTHSHS